MNKSIRVVLAEDDADDVEIFADVIAELAMPVDLTTAPNGVALMKLLNEAEVPPELIFLDLNMPLKNGLQCLQEIRANLRWNTTAVVVLSTSNHQDTVAEAYRRGANYYLPKFTDYRAFKTGLAACLKKEWPERTDPFASDQ